MATAERIYADPSARLKLYDHEPESAAMSRWRERTRGALPLTDRRHQDLARAVGRTVSPAD